MRLHLLISTTLLGLSLVCTYGQELGFSPGQAMGKLPKDVLPHAYKIELVPDLAQLSMATGRERVGFKGIVQIDIEVRRPVEAIVLNANDISFLRVATDGAVSKVEVDQRSQTAKIIPPQTLSVSTTQIEC